MSMKINTLGASRSLINKFIEMKKVRNLSGNAIIDTSVVLNSDSGKTSLLGERRKSAGVELKNITNLEFMDIFDKTNLLYKEIQSEFVKLQNEQNRRILPKFDDEENKEISNNIHRLVNFITKKVLECEENIKKISNFTGLSITEQKSRIHNKLVRDNIKLNLANKLQNITRKIRNNEEDFMAKFKELGNEETTRETSPDTRNSKAHDFLELSLNDDNILHKRDKEINSLVKSINELAIVFKEMSTLVNEQGTILDRIDYNIESAIDNTKKATKHLLQTEKSIESGCARNAIMILIVIIFVESLMLLLKFK